MPKRYMTQKERLEIFIYLFIHFMVGLSRHDRAPTTAMMGLGSTTCDSQSTAAIWRTR